MTAFVYILRCCDGRFYVGSTRGDLDKRFAEHNAGTYGGFTKSRRPVALVYSEAFERIEDAIAAERKLKGWSRAKKEALIVGDMKLLTELSRSKNSPPHPSTSSGMRGFPWAQNET